MLVRCRRVEMCQSVVALQRLMVREVQYQLQAVIREWMLPHSTTSLRSSGDVSIRSGVGRDAKDSIVAT